MYSPLRAPTPVRLDRRQVRALLSSERAIEIPYVYGIGYGINGASERNRGEMRPSLADAVRALVCARPSVQRVTPVEDGCESKEKKEKETLGVTATIKSKIRVGRYACKELRGYNSRGEVQADAKRNGSNTLSFLLLFSHSFLFFFSFLSFFSLLL